MRAGQSGVQSAAKASHMTVRLLVTGDLHLGLKRYGRQTPDGNSRVLDFAATLERFADAAIKERCDYAALLGDNFHTRHPGPRELALFTAQVKRMADAGVLVLLLPGNHDGMDTVGDPKSHTLAWMRVAQMPNVYVLTEPGITRFDNLVVASVPYPHRRALEGDTEDTSRRVEAIIEDLGRNAVTVGVPSVFLGHLSVLAAKLGSEQTMRIGYDVAVRPEVFGAFDFTFLGHIHRAQMVGERIMYVGSPDYHLFEDGGQKKAFVLADLDSEHVDLSRIDSRARKMFSIPLGQRTDGSFNDTPLVNAAMDGAMVELVLYATVERVRAAEQSRLRDIAVQQGASFVKIEVHNDLPETRNRVAIKAEDAPVAALEAWIAAQPDIPMEPTLTVGKQLIAAATTDAA